MVATVAVIALSRTILLKAPGEIIPDPESPNRDGDELLNPDPLKDPKNRTL